ncbi:MAG: extracellular solute-binding protein, partial [Anaerolineales bacterium]|nr:extracellular solute-binding protein [Anaerolineales bacterium]
MRKLTLLFLFALIALFVVACGERPQAEDTDTETDTTTETTEEAVDEPAAEPAEETTETEAPVETAVSFLERAKAGEFSGGTVTVFGKWTEAEGENFVAALAPFEEATGIDVQYEGSSEFETLITVRVEGGDAPDIAGFPQPGLMAQFVREGAIPDHAQFLNTDQLAENYSDAWINLATVNNQLSGVFYRASTKSIVWYPVQAF